jgi:hypothetical protein
LKKISDIQSLSLGDIYRKAGQLEVLQRKINYFLPEDLRAHCFIANFERGILVFAVENSAWAMRFRYLALDLLSRLRNEADLPQLSSVECYVEPEFLSLFNRR